MAIFDWEWGRNSAPGEGQKILCQGPQRSDASEARTRGLSVFSQALFHCTPYTQRYIEFCSVEVQILLQKPNHRSKQMPR